MSQHLDKMVLGDCILAKGPKGRFTYTRNMKRHIGAPAGMPVQNVFRLQAMKPAPCAAIVTNSFMHCLLQAWWRAAPASRPCGRWQTTSSATAWQRGRR
jgi:hypothetical protein